jgi:hypothetical protein
MKKVDWKTISLKDFAGVISKKLRDNGIDALLVGGACVSLYTDGTYLSYDLDFVTHESVKKISPVLEELGFRRESTRHFTRKDCTFFIEFVSPPAALGDEPVRKVHELRTRRGTVRLLSPTDSVKDRLAAFYYWNDPQALEQAILVAKAQKINRAEVKRWSSKEGFIEKFNIFLHRL